MKINDVEFNASLQEILDELVRQLRANNIQYLQKIRPTRRNIQVCCPYHANGMEKKPSAGIRESDGLFHCFACGEIHELYEVISYCFGKDDELGKFGWSWLLKNFATVQLEHRKAFNLNISRDKVKKKVEYVSEEELDSYRYIHPYMYERGLTDEVIETFDIGYDENTRCITFPVRNITGRTLFIARRSVDTKFFNYPEGVEKPLYGLYEYYAMFSDSKQQYFDLWARMNPRANEVIVCESMLDALSFWTVGKYAVALNGLGNELQFKQLRELPCRKLILCTDSDEMGMAARRKIRKNVTNKIITEYILPQGRKDANECTMQELQALEEVF